MSSTLWPNRSKAAPARCLPRPATTSWPRLLNLKYAMPAALSRVDSSRISGCPEENADPRPCIQMSAVRRRRRLGSAMTPSSQTPSRVRRRMSETETPAGLVMPGRRPDSRRRSTGSPFGSRLQRLARGGGAGDGHEGHQDVDVVTVPAVAKEPPATASDARDDPPRKGAVSIPHTSVSPCRAAPCVVSALSQPPYTITLCGPARYSAPATSGREPRTSDVPCAGTPHHQDG